MSLRARLANQPETIITVERQSQTDPNATAVRATHAGIAIGKMIGSYRIEGLLAQGGMGVVCRATDTKLGRLVAIKFLSDELDANARRRFQREAQMASALNHPHILTVHDAGEDDGRQYLVTEFVDGGTLADWLQNAEPRGWRQRVELLIGVADALAAAHAANILHRDVKPANILISKNGYAKLADFGLAKAADGAAAGAQRGSEQYTVMGAVIGTIAYMSPEQAAGLALDARSDIFSFGVVLYELLTGRRPFAGVTDLEVLQSVIHAAPAPLGDEIPEPLRRIVEKAIEKDPAERYQSMRDFVVDLRHVVRMTSEQRSESIEHALHLTPQRAVATKARRYATTAAAIIIVMAGAGLAVRSWQQSVQAERVRSETIPEVARLVEQGDLTAAFDLAQQAARHVPDDGMLKTLTSSFTSTYSLTTTPPDAEVFVRGYDAVADEWQSVGRTPLASVGVPRRALRWRIEKAGFETAELATSWRDDIAGRAAPHVPLQEIGEQPSEMVFVPSAEASRRVNSVSLPVVELSPFFIDRYEVTNEAYKEFVDAGGYERRDYWEGQEFSKDGKPLSWDEAMALFVVRQAAPGQRSGSWATIPRARTPIP